MEIPPNRKYGLEDCQSEIVTNEPMPFIEQERVQSKQELNLIGADVFSSLVGT